MNTPKPFRTVRNLLAVARSCHDDRLIALCISNGTWGPRVAIDTKCHYKQLASTFLTSICSVSIALAVIFCRISFTHPVCIQNGDIIIAAYREDTHAVSANTGLRQRY